MIIFDSNVLYGLHRNSPQFDLLMALKHSGSYPIGIPWMVLEELVAKQVLEYDDAYAKADAAITALNRKTPWARSASGLAARDIERAKRYWRNQYEEILEVIETSGENARTALVREAYCQKPAKADPRSKGGARDVAIWLSIIGYLKENPTQRVFFVSNNTRDFGDGTNYSDLMSDDLGGMKERLSCLTSFEDFVSRFTEKIEVDNEHVKSLLENHINRFPTLIESAAQNVLKDRWFRGIQVGTEISEVATVVGFQWQNWVFPPSAAMLGVSNVSGHKIVDVEWYTATVDWILVGITQPVRIYATLEDISTIERTRASGAPGYCSALVRLRSWRL